MASNSVFMENPTSTNIEILSTNNNLNELYSAYKPNSPSPKMSRSSSLSSINSFSSFDSSNNHIPDSSIAKMNSSSTVSSSQRKDSTLKLPYPVLSDHRDPSSVLVLLEKENQTTSKKISDVIKQIEDCEQRLTLNIYTDIEKKTFKYERVKLKQQLDALKKHERRVNLQIDFITTKTEIKGLEDKQKQTEINQNSDESQQIKILLGKLKQKLEKMKLYMRARNEQMKKIMNSKSNSNNNRKPSSLSSQKQQPMSLTSAKDMNRKRPLASTNNDSVKKRSKLPVPNVRLASRITSNELEKTSTPSVVVRFINKTNSSASPKTPASSSSTSSPTLIASTSLGNMNTVSNARHRNDRPSVDDDNNDELDLELDMDELFNDDSCSQPTVSRLKVGMNDASHQLQVKQNI